MNDDEEIGSLKFREEGLNPATGLRRVFLVGAWPDRAWISAELVAGAGIDAGETLSRAGRFGSLLRIRCENGDAVYTIGPLQGAGTMHLLRRVSSSRGRDG